MRKGLAVALGRGSVARTADATSRRGSVHLEPRLASYSLVLCVACGFTAATVLLGNEIAIDVVGNASGSGASGQILSAAFCAYVTLTLLPFALFLGWAQGPLPRAATAPTPFVSVVVPAFNEERFVARAIEAIRAQNYPALEVLLINDGSRDFTRLIAERQDCRVVHVARNRGKAHALNLGIREAAGEIIVFSDADSLLAPNALRSVLAPFSDPSVGAVAGVVRVRGPAGYLGHCQDVEYIFNQTIVKVAQAATAGAVAVCPGPLSAYRREVLVRIGGIKSRTLTEDHDATLEVFDAGYRIAYVPGALALTDAMPSWACLARQRCRWFHGTLQTAWQHRHLLFRRGSGAMGWFWLPYGLVVGVGMPVFEALALVVCAAAIAVAPSPLAAAAQGLGYLVVIEALVIAQYALALLVAGNASVRSVLTALLMKPFHIFLFWLRLRAIASMIRQRRPAW